MRAIVTVLLLVVAAAGPATAQNYAPAPPPAPVAPRAAPATICSTDWGWCPVQGLVTPGAGCYCFVPPATWLAGAARYWPYSGPVSPYLNPHTAPPSTLK